MLKRFFLATSILVFIGCTPSLVRACSCYKSEICNQTWKTGDVIFTGTVTSKLPVNTGAGTGGYFRRNVFQFSVSESFRGSAIAGQEIMVHTGAGGGDCGYQFEVGTSYLVYGFLSNGQLNTSICTPTSRASDVPHIIQQLRALQKGKPVADLFGMVGTMPVDYVDDLYNTKPLAGQRVRVIGSRNVEHSTTTDSEGVYSFQNLPPDTYRLDVDPPAGMSNWQLNRGDVYNVEIGAPGFAGCPASISFSPNGRISGKVVDEEGNSVAGFVTIEFVDEKEARIAGRRGGTMGYETENGEFRLWLLRPTRYRLIFQPKIRGQVDFSVPAIRSEVITLGMGQHIEDFRFKVPAMRP